MKRIGYIQGARLQGPVNLGPLGSLDIAGVSNLRGLTIMYAGFITAGTCTFGGPIIASSSLGVAGPSDLNGAVLCHSSLSVAGWATVNGTLTCVGLVFVGARLQAAAYTVGATPGANFAMGAITNLEVIEGLVTQAT